jgi:hypothetical protein
MRSLILSIAVSSSIFNVPLHANSQEAMTPTARLHFSLPFPAGFKGRFEISAASAQRTQSSTGAGTFLS